MKRTTLALALSLAAALPAAEVLIRAEPAPLPPVILNAARMVTAAAFLLPIWWLTEGRNVVLGANWLKGAWVFGNLEQRKKRSLQLRIGRNGYQ